MVIGERQLFSIAHQRGQRNPGVNQAVSPGTQHGFVDIGMHHLPAFADLFGKSHRQVARTARNIKHLVAFADVSNLHRKRLPGAVHPHGHQVIHQVVLGRYRVKHAAHVLCFFGLINRFVTKMCCCHGGNTRRETPVEKGEFPHRRYFVVNMMKIGL